MRLRALARVCLFLLSFFFFFSGKLEPTLNLPCACLVGKGTEILKNVIPLASAVLISGL